MAGLPSDPSWSWITHESEAISASPLETTFVHDPQLMQEFANPAAKRKKLDIALGAGYLSRYPISQETPSGSSRQCPHQTFSPEPRIKTSPKNSGRENGSLDDRRRATSDYPLRPPFSTPGKYEQKCSIDKNTSPTTQQSCRVAPPASFASKLSSNVATDFYFWDGIQPEDILNESSTKNGFCDRTPPHPSETSTARPSVWSCLKHRSGLQVLSSLYVATLCQRQNNGAVPPNGTFKPPPRVTLTDAKREMWLRDLADSIIPLRRLSRTIPHGIRGKALLDQCLSKAVPPLRVVWLAKCVGANEVRAFKRKGSSGAITTGGEAKWTEEWTCNVEQFLELSLIDYGSQDWKAKLIYALQLVAYFCSEQLLDRRHFDDWITASFKDCKVDRIPMWLLVVQIHWKEIWRFRHCGKELAEAMLRRISQISGFVEGPSFLPLLHILTALLRTSVHAFLDSFVFFGCWRKYESVFKRCMGRGRESDIIILDQLINRNTTLLRPVETALLTSNDMPRQRLILALDDLAGAYDIKSILASHRDTVTDTAVLVNTILEWSITPFGPALNRLYLGVRLLRLWREEGIEIGQSILQMIGNGATRPELQIKSIYRLVAELIRSRHFSTSRYLQWLLAMEPGLSNYPRDETSPDQRRIFIQSHTGRSAELPFLLLRHLPLQGLPNHTLNLRQTLLGRHGHLVQEETKKAAVIREVLVQVLPATMNDNLAILRDFHALDRFEMDDLSTVAEVSHLIRSTILARRERQSSLRNCRASLLSMDEFNFVRSFLEKHDDFSVLADVMKVTASSCERILLYDVTFTLNWHLEVFRGIGIAEAIFWELYTRAVTSSADELIELPFLLMLADLSERIPSLHHTTSFLRLKAQRCSPVPPIAACSPVADPDTDLLEGSDATFLEEMETVLTSGNSMDRPALSQLFLIITTRVEKQRTNHSQSLGSLLGLLRRLRQFDEEALDTLLAKWLELVVVPKFCQDLPRVIIPLVCSATITLLSAMDLMIGALHAIDNTSSSHGVAIRLLSLLMVSSEHHNVTKFLNTKLDFQTYRWAAERDQFLRTETSSLPLLIRTVVYQEAHLQDHADCNTCALIKEPSFLDLLHTMIIFQPKVRKELEVYLASDFVHSSVNQLGDQLLRLAILPPSKPWRNASVSSDTPVFEMENRMERLLDTVDDFNIAFARLSLTILLRQMETQVGDDGHRGITSMLFSAAVSADDAKFGLLLNLVSVPRSSHALEIHTKACLILFVSLATMIPGAGNVGVRSGAPFEKLLLIIDVAETRIQEHEPTTAVAKLSDTILTVRTVLLRDEKNYGESPSPAIQWISSNEFLDCMNTIFRLVVIHRSRLQTPRILESILIQMVVDLIIILTYPALQTQTGLLSCLFDHVALLSDQLTLESRSICHYALGNQYDIRDARVEYLLGHPKEAPSDSLRLASHGPRSYDCARSIFPSNSMYSDNISGPFSLRRWEMVQDATPNASENDTSLNLSLFGTRKALT